jgi:hypothetical protein
MRVKSFQSYTTEHTLPVSIPATQAMIEDYLGRDDDELLRLKAESDAAGAAPGRRAGRVCQRVLGPGSAGRGKLEETEGVAGEMVWLGDTEVCQGVEGGCEEGE